MGDVLDDVRARSDAEEQARNDREDSQRLGAAARSRHKHSQGAYRAGKRGDDFDDYALQHGLHDGHPDLDEAQAAHAQGVEDAAAEAEAKTAKAEAAKAVRAQTPALPTDHPVRPVKGPDLSPGPATNNASLVGPSLSVGDDGASALAAAVAFALALSYLRYGWPGVTGWLSAKFLNKVTINVPATTATPATTQAQ